MSQGNPTQHEIDVYAGAFVLKDDQSKAWRKTFPTSKCTDESVHSKASNFHKLIKVQSRIVELQAETAQNDAEEFDLSVTELKQTLKDIIDIGMGKKLPEVATEEMRADPRAALAFMNLAAANSSVQEFNRMCGNHATVKTINANVDLSELSDEALDAKIKAMSYNA